MNKSGAHLNENLNGFQTYVWGPPFWMFLHIVSLNYTPSKKAGYKRFLKSLQYILPCGACRVNYRRILKTKLPFWTSEKQIYGLGLN